MEKDIAFSVNGMRLNGKLWMQETPLASNPAILFLHGWESRQDRFFRDARKFSALGYICLTFNMRGHGESDGDVTQLSRQDFLDDTIAAYDFLAKTEGVDVNRVIVIGSSFGGYLAPLLSKERSLYSLVLRAPANYPDVGFELPHYGRGSLIYDNNPTGETEWRHAVRGYTETRSLAALHDFPGKVLLVESGKDEVVPHEVIESYRNAIGNPLQLAYVLMKDASHSLWRNESLSNEFAEIVVEWLEN